MKYKNLGNRVSPTHEEEEEENEEEALEALH